MQSRLVLSYKNTYSMFQPPDVQNYLILYNLYDYRILKRSIPVKCDHVRGDKLFLRR